MLKNTKAVLFDMDGTLTDSMWIWKEIDVEFLGGRNLSLPKDLQRQIEGMSMAETAGFFRDTFQMEETVEELMDIWNGMAMDVYREKVLLKPGALEFLQYLKAQDIAVGIATSNSIPLVEAVLKAQKIEPLIDVYVTANEVSHGKPFPDVYLEAAKRLGVAPSQCLVFEDILPGIAAGHNAGMRVCTVYDDYSSDVDEQKRAAADYYIHDYWDIAEIGSLL